MISLIESSSKRHYNLISPALHESWNVHYSTVHRSEPPGFTGPHPIPQPLAYLGTKPPVTPLQQAAPKADSAASTNSMALTLLVASGRHLLQPTNHGSSQHMKKARFFFLKNVVRTSDEHAR